MAYNPFEKEIDQLTAADLNILVTNAVAEGYWVEYKSDFQTNQKIAKSISSFANTYGGWYFIGVEADKTHNVATNVCGFDLTVTSDPIAKVRDIIRSSIDPAPLFYLHLIEIGNNRAVLVARIPNEQETPFITSDGRIYRRVGDSSEPVAENNRYALDRLYDNGREIAHRFEQFCQDDRDFSQAEKGGWLFIGLEPYPAAISSRLAEMLLGKTVENLLELSKQPLNLYDEHDKVVGNSNLPFNSGHLGPDCVVLRQVKPTAIAFNSLTVKLYSDGRAKLYLPLAHTVEISSLIPQILSPKAKQALKHFTANDIEGTADILRPFDIKQLWNQVVALMNFYRHWLEDEEWVQYIRVGIMLEQVWRTVPFLDSDTWGTQVQKFGLPVMDQDTVSAPEPISSGYILSAGKDRSTWMQVCAFVGMSFGLPLKFVNEALVSPQSTSGNGETAE